MIELVFLFMSVRRLIEDAHMTCESDHLFSSEPSTLLEHTSDIFQLRRGLIMLDVLHLQQFCRMIFKIYYFVKKSDVRPGCFSCLLVDCYCFCSFVVYGYSQVFYWSEARICDTWEDDASARVICKSSTSDETDVYGKDFVNDNGQEFCELVTWKWLFVEVFYQYFQVFFYLFWNCLAVCSILA